MLYKGNVQSVMLHYKHCIKYMLLAPRQGKVKVKFNRMYNTRHTSTRSTNLDLHENMNFADTDPKILYTKCSVK
jgi:hypothetical protein